MKKKTDELEEMENRNMMKQQNLEKSLIEMIKEKN
jgi:hypothetical protein